MGALLEGTFFTDKIRGAITLFLLLLIVGVMGFQYIFPRHPPVDTATLDALRDVKSSLERVASNLEVAGQSSVALNETLTRQLDAAEEIRNKGYASLLKLYGLDLALPVDSSGNPFGVPAQDVSVGGKLVPPGASPTGTNKQLQVPAAKHKGTTNPSRAQTPDQEPHVTEVSTS